MGWKSPFLLGYALVAGLALGAALLSRAWLVGLFGPAWWLVPVSITVCLACGGLAVYFSVASRAEAQTLREQRQYHLTLLQASVGMTRIRELEKLLQLMVHVLTRSIKLDRAGIFLHERTANSYCLKASRDQAQLPIGLRLGEEASLIRWLTAQRRAFVVADEHLPQPAGAPAMGAVVKELQAHQVAVVIPSFLGRDLLGFLVLGPKHSGRPYTATDLELFTTLANQATLAIENALAIEELQRTQGLLAQDERKKMMGLMASGMSHQIHNRLTILSGEAQLAKTLHVTNLDQRLEQLGVAEDERAHLLKGLRETFASLADEAKKTSEIVRKLRDFSKPSKDREWLHLPQLLQNTWPLVRFKHEEDAQPPRLFLGDGEVSSEVLAAQQEASPPSPLDGVPKVWGDRSQLDQVLYNLLDNAWDAIVMRRQKSMDRQEPGCIRVTFQPSDETLTIRLADNGIGATPEDLAQFFAVPYFTTKPTAQQSGTGMGLFVIQTIIENHRGTIRAESTYGQGTTFIIALPLNPPSNQAATGVEHGTAERDPTHLGRG